MINGSAGLSGCISALNRMSEVFGLRLGPGEGARPRQAAGQSSNGMYPSWIWHYARIQWNGEAFAAAFETGVESS